VLGTKIYQAQHSSAVEISHEANARVADVIGQQGHDSGSVQVDPADRQMYSNDEVTLDTFNQTRGRTQAQVLGVLDKAIANQRAKAPLSNHLGLASTSSYRTSAQALGFCISQIKFAHALASIRKRDSHGRTFAVRNLLAAPVGNANRLTGHCALPPSV
jgi:hypothetical protein